MELNAVTSVSELYEKFMPHLLQNENTNDTQSKKSNESCFMITNITMKYNYVKVFIKKNYRINKIID